MSKAGIKKSFAIEFRKSRWLIPMLMVLSVLGINLAYLFWGMTPEKIRLSDTMWLPWEESLFSLLFINTLFLSVFMAILASRTFDMEHKASSWNLLQTIQSKNSIFFGKILFGFFWLLLFCLLQGVSLNLIIKSLGFAGDIPYVRILLALSGELISGMVVYSIGALLSFMFSSQFASLSINLGGTLAGFFLMLVTTKPVTPWSLLPALRAVDMTFQEADSSAHYSWYVAPVSYWLIAGTWLIAVLIIGILIFHKMEEGVFSPLKKTISIKHRFTPVCRQK